MRIIHFRMLFLFIFILCVLTFKYNTFFGIKYGILIACRIGTTKFILIIYYTKTYSVYL